MYITLYKGGFPYIEMMDQTEAAACNSETVFIKSWGVRLLWTGFSHDLD